MNKQQSVPTKKQTIQKTKSPKVAPVRRRGPKRPTFKVVYDSPYAITWPVVPEKTGEEIIAALQKDLTFYNDKIAERKTVLSLGLNVVTKDLEKNKLALVIVCKDVEPVRMIQHLPLLAFVNNTPLCALKSGSLRLASVFKIRTLIAIGFKKLENNIHNDLISFIISKTPALNIPWLDKCRKIENQTASTQLRAESKMEIEEDELKERPEKRLKIAPPQPSSATTLVTPLVQSGPLQNPVQYQALKVKRVGPKRSQTQK